MNTLCLATCGGMALCATCHVKVEEVFDNLSEPGDQEMDQLDILPNAEHNSRLACQLRLHPDMDGIMVRPSSRRRINKFNFFYKKHLG